jgi:small multidrug resistance family-3 protein
MVEYTASGVLVSIALFVAAGLCEIGGGWLVWKWRRDDWHWGFFLLGSVILIAYGIIPTLQEQSFGRTYAAYGGFFIILAIMWGWALDGSRPDKWDLIGAAIACAGVALIMFTPRRGEGMANAMATATITPAPTPLPEGV